MLPRPDARASGARPGRLSDEGDHVSVGATARPIAAIEAEAAARKRRLAPLSMPAPGREPPDLSCFGDRPTGPSGLRTNE
jgi:hypothetical protein